MIFLKTRSDFRTYRQIDEIDYDLCPESYDDDGGTVTLPAEAAGPEDAGAWLIHAGWVYLAENVVPGTDKVTVRTAPPIRAFDREVLYPGEESTAAAFVAAVLEAEWISQTDPAYRIAALTVLQESAAGMIKPDEVIAAEEALGDGETLGPVLFNVYGYLVKLRNNHGIHLDFTFSGDVLTATVRDRVYGQHNIVFGDGRSILDSEAYGDTDTVAKVTVIAGGEATDFYRDEYGDIQTSVPEPRAAGQWKTILAPDEATEEEIAQAAADAFGEAAGAQKVEFWSETDMALGDAAVMRLHGRRVVGCISRVEITSANSKRRYATGDLATTLTDKIRKRG